jgi:hypothetical protein
MKMAMAETLLNRGRRLLNPLRRSRVVEQREVIPDSPFGESFRLLALNLRVMLADRSNKGIAVVSAYPGDGRSMVAANVAVALADGGAVLLVDSYGAAGGTLRESFAVRGPDDPEHRPQSLPAAAYATHRDHVWLLNGAGGTPGSAGGLSSAIQQASSEGVFTVVDTPPAATSSVAFSLAREVGQAIYVVRSRNQDMGIHRGIREQLRRLDVEVIGLVVNER